MSQTITAGEAMGSPVMAMTEEERVARTASCKWKLGDFYEASIDPDDLTPHAMRLRLEATGIEVTDELIRRTIARLKQDMIYKNDTYQVNISKAEPLARGFPDCYHLSIKRIDREPIHDWRDLQEIKNVLIGPEHEGFELYPAESRVVDTANQYHLWVFKDPDVRLPIGWTGSIKMGHEGAMHGAKQRPFVAEG